MILVWIDYGSEGSELICALLFLSQQLPQTSVPSATVCKDTTDCLFINWITTIAKLPHVLPRDLLSSILFSFLYSSSAVLGGPSLFIPVVACSLLMFPALWLTPWPPLLCVLWPGSLQWLCTYLLLCFGEIFRCLSPTQWSQLLFPLTLGSTYMPAFIH